MEGTFLAVLFVGLFVFGWGFFEGLAFARLAIKDDQDDEYGPDYILHKRENTIRRLMGVIKEAETALEGDRAYLILHRKLGQSLGVHPEDQPVECER